MDIKRPTINLKSQIENKRTEDVPLISASNRRLLDSGTERSTPKTDKNKTIEDFLQGGQDGKREKMEFILPLKKIGSSFNMPFLKNIKFDLSQPIVKKAIAGIVLFFLVIICGYYFAHTKKIVAQTSDWYAIKLVNNEMYFGQVADIKADPLAIKNVYYNYQGKDETDQSSNLRLVKRGKESYGPSGEMLVVRSQVVYIEPLKNNSKVLEAILDYEK